MVACVDYGRPDYERPDCELIAHGVLGCASADYGRAGYAFAGCVRVVSERA